MVAPILALQLPDPDMSRARIVAVTRDPKALHFFREAVLKGLRQRVLSANTQAARQLAESEYAEIEARLDLVLN
jgi:hypothetical protein